MIKKKTRQIKVISILNTLISLDEFAYPGVILLSHILGEVESNVLFIVNTTNFVLFYQFMTPLWNPILKIKKKILFLYESIYAMAIEKFYTFHHLVDSYRNTISEWAMGFRYGNFTLKLAREKKSLASRGPTALGRQAFLPVL